jgi:hypothetical protein
MMREACGSRERSFMGTDHLHGPQFINFSLIPADYDQYVIGMRKNVTKNSNDLLA